MAHGRFSWDATAMFEALSSADVVLWSWEPERDCLRFTGAARALGISPLTP
jgi:c-di-GMP-specific phosphodiesterase